MGQRKYIKNYDKVRNEMIISDVKKSIEHNQTPVILTKFKEHAKLLYDALKNEADHVFLLYGDNSDKENTDIRVRLKQVPRTESLILVATRTVPRGISNGATRLTS